MVTSTVPLTVHLQNLSLRAKEGCLAQHEAALHCHSSSGMYGYENLPGTLSRGHSNPDIPRHSCIII